MGGQSLWSTWMRKMKVALGLTKCLHPFKTNDDIQSTPSTSSSTQICAICLTELVKATEGQAIFTAECSHSFHFQCITSNAKHGNLVCPVCRAKWKEVPLEKSDSCVKSSKNVSDSNFTEQIEMRTYPEVSAVARSACFNSFGIVINLKAPIINRNTRAPVDLVAVLDISGSMEGKKIALLKQAMGFLVQNLQPSDQLSVIVFSSSAFCLFPLCYMTETKKRESLHMINSLVANWGTEIAKGLELGAKVMTGRKIKNPVSSMILLSDGQDNSIMNQQKAKFETRYQSLLPSSIQVPIHTFGFGTDHDALAMHFIAERTGGTFSFIEAESVIQDAFAQCLGGILTVVAQDLRVEVECVHPALCLGSIKAGSYKVGMDELHRSGFIEVGDLYAQEERDFLVEIDIPVDESGDEMSLVKLEVVYKDPIRETTVRIGGNEEVMISRPISTTPEEQIVPIEVDRQRNRLRATAAIAEAQAAAELGDLTRAGKVLNDCRVKLKDSVSGRGGDRFCACLVAELGTMMDRMVSLEEYESTGRAYMLSGLSSHLWQRATARGDSTESTTEIHSYQTQAMGDMVGLSQTMVFSMNPSTSVVDGVSKTANF